MQKWEYMSIIKSRSYHERKGYYFQAVTDWSYNIYGRGVKEVREWKGSNICSLLCELGDQGWELVTSSPRSDFLGAAYSCGGATSVTLDYAGFTSSLEYMLKRPKE